MPGLSSPPVSYTHLLFSGDAYVDHPAFGAAVIGRLLQAEGYRVAIVPQPNWRDEMCIRDSPDTALPRPRQRRDRQHPLSDRLLPFRRLRSRPYGRFALHPGTDRETAQGRNTHRRGDAACGCGHLSSRQDGQSPAAHHAHRTLRGNGLSLIHILARSAAWAAIL